ncbi:MAG: hypothetical protein K0R65_845 [Crocinitomicaceae bacterium]|jgi:integrase|nr:hypothetical protein [Crocinitomicaceae bacterium]
MRNIKDQILKIKYFLKSGLKGLIPVRAVLSFGYSEFDMLAQKKVYKPVQYYTPLKVESKEWNGRTNQPYSREHQMVLSNFEQRVRDVFSLLKLKRLKITPINFKEALDMEFGKVEVVDKMRIRMADYIDNIIIPSGKFKGPTVKRYKTTRNNIHDFEKATGRPLYAADVDENVYKSYMDFIRGKVEKNNSLVSYMTYFNSTLSKIASHYKIKLFKANRDLDKVDRIKQTIEEKVYLTFEDILKVIKFIPKTAKMRNVKLIFLTLLLTGCRHGDVFKVKPEFEYRKGTESFVFTKFITQKNQKETAIPLLKPLMDAFKQNKGPAKYMNSNDFGKDIKTLVKDSGITRKVSLSYTDTKGNKKMYSAPFHELVTTHTGRRSFITNLINYIPITVLCKITTHELKDKSIIFVYDKTSLEQNAVLFIRYLKRAMLDFKKAFPFRLI